MGTFSELERAIATLPADEYLVVTDPPSRAEVADVPPELAKLYATFGSLLIEVRPELWPRPKALDVLPSWRFELGFRVFPPQGEERAFLRRTGARWSGVLTPEGVGTWEPDGDLEEEAGDPIDLILREIAALRHGVDRIRKEAMSAAELMAEGRAAKWGEPLVFDILDYLARRPGAELAPHVEELCRELLPRNRHTLALLDLIARAGPETFRRVASQVYAIDDARGYVIELLGKVGDTSPEAIGIYREAFESGDDLDRAFDAVQQVVRSPDAKPLAKILKKRVDEWEGARQARAIALLAQLGEPFVKRAEAVLGDYDADALAALVSGLVGLPLQKIAPRLLERYRSFDPKDGDTLTAIEALVEAGIEDRATMEPVVRGEFLPRGAYWAERAEALLARWK